MLTNTVKASSVVLIGHLTELAKSNQDETLFWNELSRALKELVGHHLFTVLKLHGNGIDVERVFSSNPDAYAVGGKKALRSSPWAELVLERHQNFIGHGKKDLEWAFADHELIISLGMQSVLNVPLVQCGQCYGSLNLLMGSEHIYTEEDARQVKPFAELAVATLSRMASQT